MAEIKMKNLIIEIGEKKYKMIGSRLEDICKELGISEDRFIEILSRDAYCPTLSDAPTSSTLTYIDTDGSTNHFHIGQLCRWAEGSDYRLAVCKNVTQTSVAWHILPTKVSELTNDAGYLTSHQDISHLATKTELEKKQDIISDLDEIRSKAKNALQEVPSGYVTESELEEKGYATKGEVPTDYLGFENVGIEVEDSVEYLTTSQQSLSDDEKERVKSNIGVNVPIVEHGTGDSTFALTPNKYHRWGTMSSLTLTLASPNDTSVVNNYAFEFTSGGTATTLLVPSSIQWVNDITVEAGKRYQGIVNNGVGVLVSVLNE